MVFTSSMFELMRFFCASRLDVRDFTSEMLVHVWRGKVCGGAGGQALVQLQCLLMLRYYSLHAIDFVFGCATRSTFERMRLFVAHGFAV